MSANINILNYHRIMIVGNNGSGKSYLAKKLADITSLPLVHLDNEYWQPNWQAPTAEEWAMAQEKFVAREKWIIDGVHAGTMDIRFNAAGLLIYLDVNRAVCITGVIARHGKKRSDFPDYLEERYDKNYLSFLKGLWNFKRDRLPQIMALRESNPSKAFLTIKGRKQMKRLLKEWQALK